MFIVSMKAQNIKLALSLAVSAIAVALVVTLVPAHDALVKQTAAESGEVLPAGSHSEEKIKDNAGRIAFLKKFGWTVEENAREAEEIILPEEFDPVYENYNSLQNAVGFDLQPYAGKPVKRYTYLVTNYEYDGEVLADLLIYRDRVIGGDLRSAVKDGFLHSLTDEEA